MGCGEYRDENNAIILAKEFGFLKNISHILYFFLWRGGRKRKRWVTSLTSPYLRQMRRGSIHHASIESTLCGACRHRLQPPRGPCVGYLIDKVVRLHVLSDVR